MYRPTAISHYLESIPSNYYVINSKSSGLSCVCRFAFVFGELAVLFTFFIFIDFLKRILFSCLLRSFAYSLNLWFVINKINNKSTIEGWLYVYCTFYNYSIKNKTILNLWLILIYWFSLVSKLIFNKIKVLSSSF